MEHYRSLPDDELLSIYVSADLTDEARGLLSRELTARGLTENDVEDARRIDDYLMAELRRAFRRGGIVGVAPRAKIAS